MRRRITKAFPQAILIALPAILVAVGSTLPWFLPHDAAAQSSPETTLLFPGLVRVADGARERNPALSAKASLLQSELTALLSELEVTPANVQREYDRSFGPYRARLSDVLARRSDGDASDLIDDVLADVRVKRQYLTSGFGFRSKTKFLVELRVTTVDETGAQRHGYEIACNPRRFSTLYPAVFPFNGPTSPAAQSVPPGIYTLAARKDGKIVSATDVTVGLRGNETEDVVILVR